MTYPNGQGLYDLEPTDAELDALAEVLAEVEAEEALDELPGEADLASDYGPWDDYTDLSGGLERASAALDAQMGTGAASLGEDIQDAIADTRRPKSEDKLARAFDRIARGTYTPPGYYRPAEPETACHAHRDAYGRCGARFHSPLCIETARGEAATGSARAAEAWNAQLLANQEDSPVDLASPTGLDTSWDDLLGPDGGPGVPADWDTIGEMRKILGITAAAPRHPWES
jgi:hypothetical protein